MPAEENVFLDDCAMRPLKALGEENRRKSAPAFHHVLRDSTEWRVNDNDENLSSRIVSDDDESFLSTDTDPALDSYRRSRSLDSRRIGQWQGKVEYALRKSVALDASMSPVNSSPSIRSPSLPRPRNHHRLVHTMASAVRRSRDLGFFHQPRAPTAGADTRERRDHRLLNHVVGMQAEDIQGLKAKVQQMDHLIQKSDLITKHHADLALYKDKCKAALAESDRAKHLLAQSQDQVAAVRAQSEAHQRKHREALQEVESLREESERTRARQAQREKDYQTCLQEKERLRALVHEREEEAEALKQEVRNMASLIQKADESGANGGGSETNSSKPRETPSVWGPAESCAATCAMGLMSKVDDLVREKAELESLLCELWNRTKEANQIPTAIV